QPPGSTPATSAALLPIPAFAVLDAYGFVQSYRPSRLGPPQRVTNTIMAVLIALTLVASFFVGIGALGMVSYLVAYGMFSQPLRRAFGLALFWLLLTAVLLLVTSTFAHLWFFILIVLMVAVVTGIVRLIDSRQEEHQRTRQELGLVAERERVARD